MKLTKIFKKICKICGIVWEIMQIVAIVAQKHPISWLGLHKGDYNGLQRSHRSTQCAK